MINFSKLRLKVMAIALGLTSTISFAQSAIEVVETPQEEKKKIIKVQCFINGKIAPSNLAFGRKDTELALKTFPFYERDRKEKKQLFVQEFDVSLLRDGKKIANQTIFGSGSISYLASMARNEDTYLIQVKEVFEKTKDGTLKPYARGVIKLAYLFYDLDVFKPTLQGNAISANDVK
ncbi:hypothetical protein [Emticicia sp. W12TSBA100-4]|uniref:hypothetical protein n=1 Tax=Emticicia sp. W12TSBA100-4 TaxID=3160965 RepID=UPI003306881F